MAEIPKYYARIPQRVTQLPRAPSAQLADVGQGIEAQAIAGLGAATVDIATKWYEREGNSQFDTSRRLAREKINAFNLTDFPDSASHDTAYERLKADIKTFPESNNSGSRKYQRWFDFVSPNLDNIAAEKKIRMIARHNAIAYFKNTAAIATEPDFATAQAEARLLTQGAIDDKVRTPAQAHSDFERIMDGWIEADVWNRATAVIRPDGEVDWSQAVEWFAQAENVKGLPADVVDNQLENAKTQKALQDGRDDERLEEQQEIDRGMIYDKIHQGAITRAEIEATSLDEKEQFAMWEMTRREAKRQAEGELIITDPQVRSQILRDTTSIITGAKTRSEVMAQANEARFGNFADPANPTEPTIDEGTYNSLVSGIEAQYEQGFGQAMSKVTDYAEGILLNPDSLGFIKNAPVRHRTFGDFQEAWLEWVAEQGDKLKLSDIYPEGRRMAATYQISDEEAERQETEIQTGLRVKESKPELDAATARSILEEAGGDKDKARKIAKDRGFRF
jgi:hypothetical protein